MDFFQITPIPSNTIQGYYDYKLVIFSYLVAIFASYVALSIAGNLRSYSADKKDYWIWFFSGALVMGTGIFTMHFIGMEAYILPMRMLYNSSLTFISWLIAVLASGFALFLVAPKDVSINKILSGGFLMGIGIASMHYIGMIAMEDIKISYIPSLFVLSIIVAIIASQVALWLMIKNSDFRWDIKYSILSAILMGIAICGMHYIGMVAAVMTPLAENSLSKSMHPMHSGLPPFYIGLSSTLIMLIFLASSSNNQKFILFLQRNNDILKKKEIELEEARKRAEHANIAKSYFLANISHEIRTPLNVIIGASSLLSKSDLNPKNKHYVDKISLSSQILLNLIVDILDFSKIEAGEMILYKKNVNFVSLVMESVNVMSGRAEEKKLKIYVNCPHKDPINIYTDPFRVQQVITNLLSNAIKFTDKGVINVNIILNNTENFSSVRLEVEDEGIGINEQDSGRIFKKFSQVDDSYTRRYGGAGLGLAICKELMHLLDGKIGFISKLGEGSTFWFELPCSNSYVKTEKNKQD